MFTIKFRETTTWIPMALPASMTGEEVYAVASRTRQQRSVTEVKVFQDGEMTAHLVPDNFQMDSLIPG